MKRLMLFALTAIAAIALSGCLATGENGNRTEDSFVLRVANHATDEIYGLHMDYYLHGELRGGFGVINADGSPIAAGETLDQEFLISDFPAGADLSSLAIEVSVILADEAVAAVATLDTSWQFGQTYDYLLGGDHRQGYTLTETGRQ